MEPAVLRFEILRVLGEHKATRSSALLDDQSIASRLNVSANDVQDQLDILEGRGLVKLRKMMGPRYDALLTPKGMEALEAAQQAPPPQRRIGF